MKSRVRHTPRPSSVNVRGSGVSGIGVSGVSMISLKHVVHDRSLAPALQVCSPVPALGEDTTPASERPQDPLTTAPYVVAASREGVFFCCFHDHSGRPLTWGYGRDGCLRLRQLGD